MRGDQARLSAQASQLELWASQLQGQQARLEELEGDAAAALTEARDAAAAALRDRDQVRLMGELGGEEGVVGRV